jgi:MoaA/NifB/PqqE/SkfB family radical SAM enzyme
MKIKKSISTIKNLYVTRKNPFSIVHFVTNRCNARCSFCFIDFDNEDIYKDQLSIEEIDQFTRNLGENLFNVNLTGGEPFLRKDFTDVARCYYKNTEIESIFITSNGSFPAKIKIFTEELQSEFPEKKIIYSFSVDSFPDRHNEIRKVKNLFDKTLESYNFVKNFGGNVFGTVCITVSLENCNNIIDIYETLLDQYSVEAVSACLVRDEGVYQTSTDNKIKIIDGYNKLTSRITLDLNKGVLKGYDRRTLQGRLMNRKNKMMYDILKDTYVNPRFVSQCYAGSLFGVMYANGEVNPCEILNKPLGKIQDYDYDFLKLWSGTAANETRDWIKNTKCNCTYECAWTYNLLGNLKYQPDFLASAILGS